jgi:hypothetical protein
MHRIGNAPGDRALAGDADDQGTLAVQESHASSKKLNGAPSGAAG